MGVGCCVTRDRNDKVIGIEKRNEKFFYFNYPNFLKEIDNRLNEAAIQEKPSHSDLTYLKFMLD